MRNLKKVLSLALALVMLVGMMVVGAGATSFKDDASIKNQEAVDVVSGLEVLLGDDTGNFNPQGNLTRAQAATVIAKLDLGAAFGNLVTTNASSFSDVAADYWGKPYIDYCAARGLILGVGGGRYDPEASVTGVQFALMVCRVLGYEDANENITGANWETAAAALARKAGLTNNVALSSQPMTRDDMAQVAFNALQADMVEYDGRAITLPGGITIPAGKAEARTNNGVAQYDTTATVSTGATLQLCEEKFPNLKLVSTGRTDGFGRPASAWTYDRKDLFTKANAAYVTYTSKVNATTVANDLAGYQINSKTLTDTSASTESNFVTTNKTVGDLTIDGDNNTFAKAIAALTGNGKVVSIYTNATTGSVTSIVAAEYKLAQVKMNNANAKTITVTAVAGSPSATVTDSNKNKDFYNALSGKAVDDYVIVAFNSDTVLDIAEPSVVSGTYTRKTGTDKYTVGGVEYTASANNTLSALSTLNANTVYDLYLDTYGYILYAKVSEGAETSDAWIMATSRDGTAMSGYSYNAQLLKTDGTVEWVSVYRYNDVIPGSAADGSNTIANNFAGDSAYKDKFTTYTVNEDGTYNLAAVTASATNGFTSITTGDPNLDSVNSISANSKTVFLVKQGDGTYKAYTGIRSVPNMTGITAASPKVFKDGTVAKVVIIENGSITGTDNRYIYFYDNTPTDTRLEGNDTVYTYNAIVNGAKTPVDTVLSSVTAGLYVNCPTNAAGYVSALPANEVSADFSTAGNSKLGAKGNIAVKYDDTALTIAVANGVLTLTAKAPSDIVIASGATGGAAASGASVSVSVSDTFNSYTVVEGARDAAKADYLALGRASTSKRADIVVTVNADGEATALYVLGADALPAAETPTITADLSTTAVYYAKDTAAAGITALDATSTVSDGGAITYQWQSATIPTGDTADWANIAGDDAKAATYKPVATTAGTTYYRCVITNTLAGHSNGVKTSAAAEVHVINVTPGNLDKAFTAANKETVTMSFTTEGIADSENVTGTITWYKDNKYTGTDGTKPTNLDSATVAQVVGDAFDITFAETNGQSVAQGPYYFTVTVHDIAFQCTLTVAA